MFVYEEKTAFAAFTMLDLSVSKLLYTYKTIILMEMCDVIGNVGYQHVVVAVNRTGNNN